MKNSLRLDADFYTFMFSGFSKGLSGGYVEYLIRGEDKDYRKLYMKRN